MSMEMEKLFSVLLFSSLPERLFRFMRENGGKIRKGRRTPKLAEIEPMYMAGPEGIKQICRRGTCGWILVVGLVVVWNCWTWWSLRAFQTLMILWFHDSKQESVPRLRPSQEAGLGLFRGRLCLSCMHSERAHSSERDAEPICRKSIQGGNCFVSANTSPLTLELVSCTIRARGQSLPIQSPRNSIPLLRSISSKQGKARFVFTPQIPAWDHGDGTLPTERWHRFAFPAVNKDTQPMLVPSAGSPGGEAKCPSQLHLEKVS